MNNQEIELFARSFIGQKAELIITCGAGSMRCVGIVERLGDLGWFWVGGNLLKLETNAFQSSQVTPHGLVFTYENCRAVVRVAI